MSTDGLLQQRHLSTQHSPNSTAYSSELGWGTDEEGYRKRCPKRKWNGEGWRKAGPAVLLWGEQDRVGVGDSLEVGVSVK